MAYSSTVPIRKKDPADSFFSTRPSEVARSTYEIQFPGWLDGSNMKLTFFHALILLSLEERKIEVSESFLHSV